MYEMREGILILSDNI